jgi:hypothetical protein
MDTCHDDKLMCFCFGVSSDVTSPKHMHKFQRKIKNPQPLCKKTRLSARRKGRVGNCFKQTKIGATTYGPDTVTTCVRKITYRFVSEDD